MEVLIPVLFFVAPILIPSEISAGFLLVFQFDY